MRFRKLTTAAYLLASVMTMSAQSGQVVEDALSGVWVGEFVVQGRPEPVPVIFTVKFDGRQVVSGGFTGLPSPGCIKRGTYDADTGALTLELARAGTDNVVFVLDGTATRGVAKGRISGAGNGEFSLDWKESSAIDGQVLRICEATSAVDRIAWVNPPENTPPGVTHGTFTSASMQVEVGYSIYLPPGYESTTSRYPVVYWLHGRGGDERDTAPAVALGQAIDLGHAVPMVLVMANGGPTSGYIDNPANGVMGESVIVRELIPHIEGAYRVQRQSRGRGLLGMSMGGAGVVRMSLRHPGLFGAVVSLGGALFDYQSIMERHFVVDEALAKGYDPYLVARQLAGRTERPRFKLFIGTADQWLEDNRRMSRHFRSLGIAHEYQELDGVQHSLGQYLDRAGRDVFAFLSENLATTGD